MFSIQNKPQETVNAEDLETLQNELERCLVDVVRQKWDLERELTTLNSNSPDPGTPTPSLGSTSAPTTSTQANIKPLSGKLRNSQRSNQVDATDNSSDCFKNVPLANPTNSAASSAEDSVSSEESIVSNLTGSTIITAAQAEAGSQLASSTSTTGTKRSHRASSDRPSKRFKQNGSKSSAPGAAFTKRPPHSKHRTKIVPSKYRNSTEESRPNKIQPPRTGAPDKLWPFVEQFCATPTTEQIQELEEMIKSMDNDKDYFKVPALGKKDAVNKDSPAKPDNTGAKNQRKSKSRSVDEEPCLGALTQRLVSSYIEEEDDFDISKSSTDTSSVKKKNFRAKANKGIDMNSAKNIEKRIRQELVNYNILDHQDDIPYTSEDDEILRELVISQHELYTIQHQNKESMQLLHKKAMRHLELQAEREKLREANADVIAAYHRLIQAKQRKRNPTKKEKDAAWKALQIQEAIFKKCDDLYLSGLSRGGG